MPPYIHRGRVAFHETDAAGIVHFANFFRYAEEAETAALISLGLFSKDTLRLYGFPRVQANAQYTAPLHFAEEYEVRASLERIGASSLAWHFDIAGAGGSCACVEMVSSRRHAATGEAAPYAPAEREALHKLMPSPPESAQEQKS